MTMSIQDTRLETAAQLEVLVKRKPKPATRRGPQVDKIKRDIDKAATIAKNENRWNEFNPKLFVALYAWLHTQVYNVNPANEVSGKSGLGARTLARNMLEKEFDNNCEEMLVFMRWVWFRERERERWRLENSKVGGRISWQYQFSARLLNEYKVAKRRFEPNFDTKSEKSNDYAMDTCYALGT
jgi:hypothetical protein